MNRYVKKALCVLLTVTFAFSLASCSGGKVSEGDIKSLFKDTSKISFSYDYTELKDSRKNKTKSWRQGMVSGNGLQGFITSGSPYSDTFIFQNMHLRPVDRVFVPIFRPLPGISCLSFSLRPSY